MPSLQLAWMVVYIPLMTGELLGRHPVLFLTILALLVPLMGCARRVRLTTDRVLVDRPLFSLLARLHRVSPTGLDEHRLRDLVRAEAEDNTLVLLYRNGVRARITPDLADAEAFAQAINEQISTLLTRKVTVTERPAATVGVQASASSTLRCPYCHDDLQAFQATACGGCNTLHHGECLSEHGKCAILGCAGRPQRVAA